MAISRATRAYFLDVLDRNRKAKIAVSELHDPDTEIAQSLSDIPRLIALITFLKKTKQ